MQPNKNNYSNATQPPQPTLEQRVIELEQQFKLLQEGILKLKAIAQQANENSKDRPEGE